LPGVQV
jgi:hypothetical protein